MPKAFLTGITGQDGSYLAELLLEKGYEVYAIMRRSSSFNTARIDHIFDKLNLVYGDLTDGCRLANVLNEVQPDEVYNLGAQSHVMVSFIEPIYTVNTNALGTLRLLEAIRHMRKPPRFYQASSSEMFGNTPPPQNEDTPLRPRSPYGCSKVYGHHQCVNYREAYGLHISNGILFNHESPRRGETFVTRKITRAATRIKEGLQDKLFLGDLQAKRDWGYAGDYVEAMWLMLQQDEPDDYVIATGIQHSNIDCLSLAFGATGLQWEKHVAISDRYIRPTDIHSLCGDASKAKAKLGWEPTVSFEELIEMMVKEDWKLAKREKLCESC